VVDEVTIKIAVRENGEGLPIPQYASPGSAGLDLRAAVGEDVEVKSGEWISVPLGFSLELPQGYEGQIRPRSGLALKYGITIINAPGTVDSDYRGEVRATLINLGKEDYTIRRGDRIAQLVISKVAKACLETADDLGQTSRGEGGFGHTGV
jgi:dUTP pyrophosphatase